MGLPLPHRLARKGLFIREREDADPSIFFKLVPFESICIVSSQLFSLRKPSRHSLHISLK